MQISHSVSPGNYTTNGFKMMWLASLLILISVGGSVGDLECYLLEQRRCDERLLPTTIPQTPEELLKTCRVVEQFASCLADASENCTYNDKETIGMRHTVGYISATCQEANPIFEVLSSNLDCIQEVDNTMSISCMGPLSEEALEAIMEHIQPLIENEQFEQLRCLEEMMYVACRAMTFERHCGERVGEAIADVLMNVKDASTECTVEIIEEVFPLFETLENILREEMEQWIRKGR